MPLKILHVYRDYCPPVAGGMERHMALMCRLQSTSEDVEAMTCSRSLRSRETVREGVRVLEVGEWGRIQGAPLSPLFSRKMKERVPDVVVLHSPNPTGEIAYLVSGCDAMLVIRYQSDVVRQALAMKLYAPLYKKILRRAQAILVSSPQYLETSIYLDEVKDRCHVVPLGILHEDFESVPKDRVKSLHEKYGGPYVLFSGKHRYYKGLEYLVSAAKNIASPIVIAGDGPETKRLKMLAQRSGARILFPGPLEDADLIAHLHGCSVFVLPSVKRSEAFGLSILEAHACGKPVVATRLGTGVEYVNIDGQTGVNVQPADAEAIAEAVTGLLAEPGRARELGRFAKERVRKDFDARDVAEKELAIYRKVLECR